MAASHAGKPIPLKASQLVINGAGPSAAIIFITIASVIHSCIIVLLRWTTGRSIKTSTSSKIKILLWTIWIWSWSRRRKIRGFVDSKAMESECHISMRARIECATLPLIRRHRRARCPQILSAKSKLILCRRLAMSRFRLLLVNYRTILGLLTLLRFKRT